MKSALLTASTFVLSNMFLIAYAGLPYPDGCPRIKPLKELTVDQLTGQYHDLKNTPPVPYYNAHYCNYKTNDTLFVTDFTATNSTTGEPYETVIHWELVYSDGQTVTKDGKTMNSIEGQYARAFFGYWETQNLWFLGQSSVPGEEYFCDFQCIDLGNDKYAYTFQFETKSCTMTKRYQEILEEIMTNNNLTPEMVGLQDGIRSDCVENLNCPPTFNYQDQTKK